MALLAQLSAVVAAVYTVEFYAQPEDTKIKLYIGKNFESGDNINVYYYNKYLCSYIEIYENNVFQCLFKNRNRIDAELSL